MKAPREFDSLCQFFNQDIMILFPSLEAAAAASVLSLTNAERQIARNFLNRMFGSLGDKEIEELWHQSPAQIGFSEPEGASHVLKLIRDALEAKLAIDAKGSEQ